MPKVVRTTKNPHGLSIKQALVIKDLVNNIRTGTRFSPTDSHLKFYNAKKRSTAAVMANENLNRPNFIEALHQELEYEVSEKAAQRLTEGLNACRIEKNGDLAPDYSTRLKYIQEINKIARIY